MQNFILIGQLVFFFYRLPNYEIYSKIDHENLS